MSYIKSKGIVIKEVNTGEADKIITIFSKSSGKLTGFAKSAKRPRGKLSAGTQFLCYSDFVLCKSKEMFNVYSSDVIEPFYEIRNDVIKLTYAAHYVDIINDVVQENQPASRVLQLFLNVLHFLSKTSKDVELLTCIFELRTLSIIGYAPYDRSCIMCSREDDSDYFFSFKRCGILCSRCMMKEEACLRLLPGTLKALRHIIHTPLDSLFNFSVSPEVLRELRKISSRYLRDRFCICRIYQ